MSHGSIRIHSIGWVFAEPMRGLSGAFGRNVSFAGAGDHGKSGVWWHFERRLAGGRVGWVLDPRGLFAEEDGARGGQRTLGAWVENPPYVF
jgi:hypothetical protein